MLLRLDRKIQGQFDDGWDRYRERTFARQALGVILSMRNVGTSREHRRGFVDARATGSRGAADGSFAAFGSPTDHEVGRLLDESSCPGRQR
jgi:hypothetical protein